MTLYGQKPLMYKKRYPFSHVMVELDSNLDPAKMGQDEAKIRLELACSDYIRQPNKEAFDFIAHNGHQMSILQFVELLQ